MFTTESIVILGVEPEAKLKSRYSESLDCQESVAWENMYAIHLYWLRFGLKYEQQSDWK